MEPSLPPTSLWRSRLETSATFLLVGTTLVVLALIAWDRHQAVSPQRTPPLAKASVRPQPPLPKEPISLAGAALRGSEKAPVVMVEYSDLQCPYSGKYARDIRPAIEEQYLKSGSVRMAFRHFPLPIHPDAQKAAEAVECAGRQGKFWQFSDWAFSHQRELNEPSFREQARLLGLRAGAFDACLGGEADEKVRTDMNVGKGLVITGTPTFFIGQSLADGQMRVIDRLTGAQPLAEFQRVLDKVLAQARPSGQ